MTSEVKKPKKYLFDGLKGGRYVRTWKEGRGHGEYMVQIWNKTTPEGEPDGDWAMPGVIGLEGSIDQAMLQTPKG
jgi:hypothetical protein